MTDNTQPEALRLADRLDLYATGDEHQRDTEEAAAELRRQHAELETLRMGYAAARLVDTVIGAAIAVVCGWLLWPGTSEDSSVPDGLAADASTTGISTT